MFDQLGINPNVNRLKVAGDLCHLHTRNGLVALVNALFSFDSVKSVVQVRMKDDGSVDRSRILGVEISLRTIEFQHISNIEMKLKERERKGMVIV